MLKQLRWAKCLCAVVMWVLSVAAHGDGVATPPITVPLWPESRLAEQGAAEEQVAPAQGDGVLRITKVTRPSMTVYRAAGSDQSPVSAVLVFPGGGYQLLAYDKEGVEVAEWLNRMGLTAVVVKYRVPKNRQGAFEDGQRAMRLVRHHAKEWGIDPKLLGVIGFSAGGHLSARLSADFSKPGYPVDEVDRLSSRPDFCMLIYPAYLRDKPEELPVSAEVPPTFIVQTKDDKRYVGATIAYDALLRKAGVSLTTHWFESGGHGYGLKPKNQALAKWPTMAAEWLKQQGVRVDGSGEPKNGS